MIALYRQSYWERPAFDTAVSRVLLDAVAAGRARATLRVCPAGDALAFSVLDRTREGFPRAVAAARAHGFEPILRLAGGRAAVFQREAVAFAWSLPAPDPRLGIRERFEDTAEIVRDALRRLGADARIGAVPGEYCPGAYSVSAGGRTKLAGVGQRVVRGAAHIGGVVVVGGSRRLREVLRPVYRALGFEFDPDAAGSLEDEIGRISPAEVAEALLAEFAARHGLVEAELDPEQEALAAGLEAEHRLDESLQPPGSAVEKTRHGRRSLRPAAG